MDSSPNCGCRLTTRTVCPLLQRFTFGQTEACLPRKLFLPGTHLSQWQTATKFLMSIPLSLDMVQPVAQNLLLALEGSKVSVETMFLASFPLSYPSQPVSRNHSPTNNLNQKSHDRPASKMSCTGSGEVHEIWAPTALAIVCTPVHTPMWLCLSERAVFYSEGFQCSLLR